MASNLVTRTVDCPVCGQPAVLTTDEFWRFGVGVTNRAVNHFTCPTGCHPDPKLLLAL